MQLSNQEKKKSADFCAVPPVFMCIFICCLACCSNGVSGAATPMKTLGVVEDGGVDGPVTSQQPEGFVVQQPQSQQQFPSPLGGSYRSIWSVFDRSSSFFVGQGTAATNATPRSELGKLLDMSPSSSSTFYVDFSRLPTMLNGGTNELYNLSGSRNSAPPPPFATSPKNPVVDETTTTLPPLPPIVSIPFAITAMAVAFNIPGETSLRLTLEELAQLLLRISKENPAGASLAAGLGADLTASYNLSVTTISGDSTSSLLLDSDDFVPVLVRPESFLDKRNLWVEQVALALMEQTQRSGFNPAAVAFSKMFAEFVASPPINLKKKIVWVDTEEEAVRYVSETPNTFALTTFPTSVRFKVPIAKIRVVDIFAAAEAKAGPPSTGFSTAGPSSPPTVTWKSLQPRLNHQSEAGRTNPVTGFPQVMSGKTLPYPLVLPAVMHISVNHTCAAVGSSSTSASTAVVAPWVPQLLTLINAPFPEWSMLPLDSFFSNQLIAQHLLENEQLRSCSGLDVAWLRGSPASNRFFSDLSFLYLHETIESATAINVQTTHTQTSSPPRDASSSSSSSKTFWIGDNSVPTFIGSKSATNDLILELVKNASKLPLDDPATTSSGTDNIPLSVSGTDVVFTAEEFKEYPNVRFLPMQAFSISVMYNLPGLDELVLPRCALVKIFTGVILYWDDPELVRFNPMAGLPHQRIHVWIDETRSVSIFMDGLLAIDKRCGAEIENYAPLLNASKKLWDHHDKSVFMFHKTEHSVGSIFSVWAVPYSISFAESFLVQSFNTKEATLMDEITLTYTRPTANYVREALAMATINDDNDRLLLSLNQSFSASPKSYPFVGISYAVYIQRPEDEVVEAIGDSYSSSSASSSRRASASSTMCRQLKNTMHFLYWIFTSAEAQAFTDAKGFASLPPKLATLSAEKVTRVACGGEVLLPRLYPDTKDKEKPEQTGMIILGCVLGFAVICFAAFVVYTKCCAKPNGGKDNSCAPQEEAEYTIIFTDVESSTALWARGPDVMGRALDQHNDIIRSAIVKHQCYEVKTIGDAFMVACKTPEQALRFALEVQRNLHTATWDAKINDLYAQLYAEWAELDAISSDMFQVSLAIGEQNSLVAEEVRKALAVSTNPAVWNGLRVRIGIATGEATAKLDPISGGVDYFGSTVNMAARIEAAGHGGQVLISSSMLNEGGSESSSSSRSTVAAAARPPLQTAKEASALQQRLQSIATFKEVGLVELKGFEHAVHLVQLLPLELEGREFPPPRSNVTDNAVDILSSCGGDDDAAAVADAEDNSPTDIIEFYSATVAPDLLSSGGGGDRHGASGASGNGFGGPNSALKGYTNPLAFRNLITSREDVDGDEGLVCSLSSGANMKILPQMIQMVPSSSAAPSAGGGGAMLSTQQRSGRSLLSRASATPTGHASTAEQRPLSTSPAVVLHEHSPCERAVGVPVEVTATSCGVIELEPHLSSSHQHLDDNDDSRPLPLTEGTSATTSSAHHSLVSHTAVKRLSLASGGGADSTSLKLCEETSSKGTAVCGNMLLHPSSGNAVELLSATSADNTYNEIIPPLASTYNDVRQPNRRETSSTLLDEFDVLSPNNNSSDNNNNNNNSPTRALRSKSDSSGSANTDDGELGSGVRMNGDNGRKFRTTNDARKRHRQRLHQQQQQNTNVVQTRFAEDFLNAVLRPLPEEKKLGIIENLCTEWRIQYQRWKATEVVRSITIRALAVAEEQRKRVEMKQMLLAAQQRQQQQNNTTKRSSGVSFHSHSNAAEMASGILQSTTTSSRTTCATSSTNGGGGGILSVAPVVATTAAAATADEASTTNQISVTSE